MDPLQKANRACCCQVRRSRATQRAGRRRTQKSVCSVVGYTNAGKSSLVSALSGSHVEAEDRCAPCHASFRPCTLASAIHTPKAKERDCD